MRSNVGRRRVRAIRTKRTGTACAGWLHLVSTSSLGYSCRFAALPPRPAPRTEPVSGAAAPQRLSPSVGWSVHLPTPPPDQLPINVQLAHAGSRTKPTPRSATRLVRGPDCLPMPSIRPASPFRYSGMGISLLEVTGRLPVGLRSGVLIGSSTHCDRDRRGLSIVPTHSLVQSANRTRLLKLVHQATGRENLVEAVLGYVHGYARNGSTKGTRRV